MRPLVALGVVFLVHVTALAASSWVPIPAASPAASRGADELQLVVAAVDGEVLFAYVGLASPRRVPKLGLVPSGTGQLLFGAVLALGAA